MKQVLKNLQPSQGLQTKTGNPVDEWLPWEPQTFIFRGYIPYNPYFGV